MVKKGDLPGRPQSLIPPQTDEELEFYKKRHAELQDRYPTLDRLVDARGAVAHATGKGTLDDPVNVKGNVLLGAQMLAEGKHIRLNKVDEVGTLLEELAKMVEEAKAKGEDAPTFDLCKVSVPKTNLFCAQTKGIPRAKMPQLGGMPRPGSRADALPRDKKGEVKVEGAFREELERRGIKITPKTVPAAYLKASQNELDGPKVAGMSKAMEEGKVPDAPIFVTRDGYIIDGHHRWASKVALDVKDGHLGDINMPVEELDMEIGEALDFANAFTNEFGILPKGLGAAAEGLKSEGPPGSKPHGWSIEGREAVTRKLEPDIGVIPEISQEDTEALQEVYDRMPVVAMGVDHIAEAKSVSKDGEPIAGAVTYDSSPYEGEETTWIEMSPDLLDTDDMEASIAQSPGSFAHYGDGYTLRQAVLIHELGHVATNLDEDAKDELFGLVADELGFRLPEPNEFGIGAHDDDPVLNKYIRHEVWRYYVFGVNRGKAAAAIGSYGGSDFHEFLSECFAEYVTNPDARPIAKKVGERIEKLANEPGRWGPYDAAKEQGVGGSAGEGGGAGSRGVGQGLRSTGPEPVPSQGQERLTNDRLERAAQALRNRGTPSNVAGSGQGGRLASAAPKDPLPSVEFPPQVVAALEPGDKVYRHPQGATIIDRHGSVVKYSKAGTPNPKTSSTSENLAAGHGAWKRVANPKDGPVNPDAPKVAKSSPPQDESVVIGPKEPEQKSKPAPSGKTKAPMTFNEVMVAEVPKYIADDNWFFQQKVDGIRAQLVIEPGKRPWFRSKSGGALVSGTATKITDKILENLGEMPEGGPTYTIDGEVLNGGWYVFDMSVDGQEKMEWQDRMAIAENWVKTINDAGVDTVTALPTARTAEEKQALYDRVYANGGEGVMMKRKDAPYVYDSRVSTMLKAKFRSSADVVVVDLNRGGKESATIGVWDNGQMVEIGSTSLIGKQKSHTFKKGEVVEVAYLYAFPDSQNIVQPTIVGFRPDKDPKEATMDQLRFSNKEVLDRQGVGIKDDEVPVKIKSGSLQSAGPRRGWKEEPVRGRAFTGPRLVDLTPRQQNTVDFYLGNAYGLNRAIWHDRADEDQQRMVTDLDEIIDQSTVNQNMTVFRIVNKSVVPVDLKPGDVLEWKAFSSTSTNPSGYSNATWMRPIYQIRVPKGSKALSIVDLYNGDDPAGESEVLLPRNSRVVVTAVSQPQGLGLKRIDVELLPQVAPAPLGKPKPAFSSFKSQSVEEGSKVTEKAMKKRQAVNLSAVQRLRDLVG